MFLRSSDENRSKFNRAKSMLSVLGQFFSCQICISRYVYRKKEKFPLFFNSGGLTKVKHFFSAGFL